MIFNRPYVAEWAAAGAFVPLNSFLGPLQLSRSHYFPFTWDEGTYRAHVYVLPVDTDSRGMSYNKALFANAGLDPDNPPVLLTAVDEAAKKLTIPDANGKYKQIGLIPWNHQGVYLFTWTPSFGGSLYDEATGKFTVNDPRGNRPPAGADPRYLVGRTEGDDQPRPQEQRGAQSRARRCADPHGSLARADGERRSIA